MSAHHTTRSTPHRPIEIALQKEEPFANHPLNNQKLTITWKVSRRALGNQAPAGTSLATNLELNITKDAYDWSLIDPKGDQRIKINDHQSSTPISITQTDDSFCVESSTFRCFIATPANSPARLLYIRTSIFEQLKLPGGRYTPAISTITAQIEN
tara:strand:+ start:167298 stop:167762 length:465 start_codon:yes stop_codon:yes gene_type:complete